jgi:hypothetical protein
VYFHNAQFDFFILFLVNKLNNYIYYFITFFLTKTYGDWGLGIGDWGLGPIPNPQSPIGQ